MNLKMPMSTQNRRDPIHQNIMDHLNEHRDLSQHFASDDAGSIASTEQISDS